eukprot:GHVL01037910.1.p1 GENE.GHVL01037910.1~~GHVL01037910.1.p1  ORF type:complete len:140 (+),score=10.77 GHVL01037910.1:549-968(+)
MKDSDCEVFLDYSLDLDEGILFCLRERYQKLKFLSLFSGIFPLILQMYCPLHLLELSFGWLSISIDLTIFNKSSRKEKSEREREPKMDVNSMSEVQSFKDLKSLKIVPISCTVLCKTLRICTFSEVYASLSIHVCAFYE